MMRDKIIDYMAHVTGCERSDCELCFDAMLDGLKDQGWQAVPVEPDIPMKLSAAGYVLAPAQLSAENAYKAMLKAAPKMEKE